MRPDPSRPLPIVLAVVWALGMGAVLFALREALGRVLPGTRTDFVTQAALVAIVLLSASFGLLAMHAGGKSPSQALGVRPAAPSLVALALGLGAVLPFAVGSVNAALLSRFPRSERAEVVDALLHSTGTTPRALGFVIATSIALPLVHELCFRGALFGALRRSSSLAAATFGAAILSVPSDFHWRSWPALLLIGLAAAHARAASGSLLPPLALHVGFGTVTTIATLSSVEPLGRGGGLASLVGWIGVATLGFLVHSVARSSEEAEEARAEDAS